MLAHRDLAEGNFRRLDDPETMRIAARVEISTDPEFAAGYPSRQGAEVRVRLVSGQTLRKRLSDLRPVEPAEIRARFRAAATQIFGDRRAREIEETVGALHQLDDVASLMKLLIC